MFYNSKLRVKYDSLIILIKMEDLVFKEYDGSEEHLAHIKTSIDR